MPKLDDYSGLDREIKLKSDVNSLSTFKLS